MTNLEKYKKYEELIDRVVTEYALSLFPDGLPEKLYRTGVNFTKNEYGSFVEECFVENVNYYFKGNLQIPSYNKRPSKIDVESIRLISESLSIHDLNESGLYFLVKTNTCGFAVYFKEFNDKKASIHKSEMEVIVQEKIEHYKANYLVREKQFACSYCRKATDNDKKIKSEIFARQYRNGRQSFDYCSGKCASHDQMAHEG